MKSEISNIADLTINRIEEWFEKASDKDKKRDNDD